MEVAPAAVEARQEGAEAAGVVAEGVEARQEEVEARQEGDRAAGAVQRVAPARRVAPAVAAVPPTHLPMAHLRATSPAHQVPRT